MEIYKNERLMRTLIVLCLLWGLAEISIGQPLDTLIQEAYHAHPLLKSLHFEQEALKENERLQGSWDAPVLNMGVGVFPVETRVGPQILKFGAQQRIPYRGSQQAKKQVVQARQYGLESKTDLMKIELAYQVRLAFYELYVLQQKDLLLDSMIEVVQAQKEDRLRRLRSGSGSTSQVLLMERTSRNYRERKKQLKFDKAESRARLAYWTGIDSISDPELSRSFITAIHNENLQLPELALHHPQIEELEAQVKLAAAEINAIKWDNYPQLTVGMDYIWNSSRSNVDIPDNGRDALIPMVGIQLPFLSSRNTRKKEEWKRKQTAARYRRENEKQALRSELISAFERLSKHRSEYEYLNQQIATTQRMVELKEHEIGSNAAEFYDYWMLLEDILDYQWKKWEATQNAQEAYFYILKYNKP